jgi:hypothetical protein
MFDSKEKERNKETEVDGTGSVVKDSERSDCLEMEIYVDFSVFLR